MGHISHVISRLLISVDWFCGNSVLTPQNEAIVEITTLPMVLPPSESLLNIRSISHAPYGQSWTNMMSSTKSEVHNVLHCSQRRTEAQVTCTENLVKFGCVVLEICKQTDIQTCRQTYSYPHCNSTRLLEVKYLPHYPLTWCIMLRRS